jgi:hypothetical protein
MVDLIDVIHTNISQYKVYQRRAGVKYKEYLDSGKLGAGGKCVGQAALAAVLAIGMEGHEDTSTALGVLRRFVSA